MSDKLDWDVVLIGYDPTQRARYLDAIIDARQSGGAEPKMDCGRRKTDLVRLIDDDDGRRSFYEALLKIQWLPSAIQGAVRKVLAQSLQKHKRSIEDARTVTLEFLIRNVRRRCGQMVSGRKAAFMMPLWIRSLPAKACHLRL